MPRKHKLWREVRLNKTVRKRYRDSNPKESFDFWRLVSFRFELGVDADTQFSQVGGCGYGPYRVIWETMNVCTSHSVDTPINHTSDTASICRTIGRSEKPLFISLFGPISDASMPCEDRDHWLWQRFHYFFGFMRRHISADIKKLALHLALVRGYKYKKIQEITGISERSIGHIRSLHRRTEAVIRKRIVDGQPRISLRYRCVCSVISFLSWSSLQFLESCVKQQPDLLLSELQSSGLTRRDLAE